MTFQPIIFPLHRDHGEMPGAASHLHAFDCVHAVAIGIAHATIGLHDAIGALVITITSFNFITQSHHCPCDREYEDYMIY